MSMATQLHERLIDASLRSRRRPTTVGHRGLENRGKPGLISVRRSPKNGVKTTKNPIHTSCSLKYWPDFQGANCAGISESAFTRKKARNSPNSLRTDARGDCQILLEEKIPGFPGANCAGNSQSTFTRKTWEIRTEASVDCRNAQEQVAARHKELVEIMSENQGKSASTEKISEFLSKASMQHP